MAQLNPVVTQNHDGILVVREDLCCDGLRSGKVRGLLPWFAELKKSGTVGVVNHAVSYSNSHAIVGFSARETGLVAVSYANCKYPTPQTKLAESLGVRMIYAGPKQLGPLRAQAKKHYEPGFLNLPWTLAHPRPYGYIAELVGLLYNAGHINRNTAHVVPIGGGGYAWAIKNGCRTTFPKWEVRVDGVVERGRMKYARKQLEYLSPFHGVIIHESDPVPTPFPSDPHYEHYAWPVACELRDSGLRVCFWSVGIPLVG